MIGNPQPIWLSLLIIALPGMIAAAYAINKAIFSGADRSLSTMPAVGLVLALLPTHLLALASGSLSVGVAISWSAIGLAGYAWIAKNWASFQVAVQKWNSGRIRKFNIALIATLPIVAVAVLLNIHDEQGGSGHLTIIGHLQNGTYPPRYLYEPSLPLHYHYAFDLAAAIVTGLLRIRSDHAIDLLTVILWPTTFLLLWRLGEHFGGRKAGLFVAATVSFSGNWPFLCASDALSSIIPQSNTMQRMLGFCAVGGDTINPPFISYFFQHPWSLGVPIFALVILQRAALPGLRRRAIGLAAITASLSLLSLAQVVLFVVVILALGIIEVWNLAKYRSRLAAEMLAVLALSLLGAKFLGGFFSSGDYPPAQGLFGTSFVLRSLTDLYSLLLQGQWNLASFGALLLLGIPGMFRVRNDRFFLAALAAVAFLILNVLRYKYSWDIAKFATVGAISLAISSGVLLSDIWQNARTHLQKFMFFILISVSLAQGLVWPIAIVIFPVYRPVLIYPYFSLSFPIGLDEADAVQFLRRRMENTDILFATEDRFVPYAIWAGLSTQNNLYAAPGTNNDSHGLGVDKLQRRRSLSIVTSNWLERLSSEGITWIVAGPDDLKINEFLDRAENRRKVSLEGQFQQVRVFRLISDASLSATTPE